jgi:peroxiredoxin
MPDYAITIRLYDRFSDKRRSILMTQIPQHGTHRDAGGGLQTNSWAPEFALHNAAGQPVKLIDYRGKNIVLCFYPADWSPVCTTELALFQETLEEIRSHNAEMLAISVDSHYSHRAWADHMHITFPLLSDFWPHGTVAKQYGIFRESDGTSERALFFVDTMGLIRHIWVAEDPGIAPSLNIVFQALEQMQEAEHHV